MPVRWAWFPSRVPAESSARRIPAYPTLTLLPTGVATAPTGRETRLLHKNSTGSTRGSERTPGRVLCRTGRSGDPCIGRREYMVDPDDWPPMPAKSPNKKPLEKQRSPCLGSSRTGEGGPHPELRRRRASGRFPPAHQGGQGSGGRRPGSRGQERWRRSFGSIGRYLRGGRREDPAEIFLRRPDLGVHVR